MNKDQWQDRIRRELGKEDLEPASGDFYRGVWSRIKAAGPDSVIESPTPVFSVGWACWKSVPICAVLVLLVLLYSWRYPPNDAGLVPGAAESYVMDSETAPTNTDLLYNVMHNAEWSELETGR